MVSLCRIFLLEIDLSLQRVSRSYLRPPLDDGIRVEQGMVVILYVHAADGTVHPETRYRRIEVNGTIIVGDSVAVFLLTNAGDSAQIKDLLDIRVEVDSLRSIALRAYIVIEIKLCHSPVVPWQPKIRLECQNLIEILNGEHVIIVMKGHFTVHDESVYIILRTDLHHRKQCDDKNDYPALHLSKLLSLNSYLLS